jgi:DNA repair photolyase
MVPLPFPGATTSSLNLVGIARLAAEGESISEGHEVEYFSLWCRSILNRCGKRMPFTWTINPYRGCEFACKYCYARYTHEFMELRDGSDFEHKIFVKQRVGEHLRRDLRRVKPHENIAIGTATDPYQPAERRFEATLAVLEVLAQHQGLEIGVVTKSNMVLRDVGVLARIAKHNRLFVNVTVTTTDAALARILEPRAPRPDLRLDAVRKLNDAGIPTGVLCAPVLPGITDTAHNLEAVVKATAQAGGRSVHANALYLKPCSSAVFLPFLEKEFPSLLEQYRHRYASGAFLSSVYRKRIATLMARLRRKYGLSRREDLTSNAQSYGQETAEQHPTDGPGGISVEAEQLPLFCKGG